jgi:hypothetical protein
MSTEEILYVYSRANAIEDGLLIDVTTTANEAGIRYPTAVTRAVWERYVAVPRSACWQDEAGRLWDIMTMLRHAARAAPDSSEIRFVVYVRNDETQPKPVTLKAVCGPGDDLEPVVTVMLPEED